MKRSTGVLRTGDRVYVTVVMTDGFRCTTHRGTAWHVA
jgi:hypothetical protein